MSQTAKKRKTLALRVFTVQNFQRENTALNDASEREWIQSTMEYSAT